IYEISENLRKKQQIFLKSTSPAYLSHVEWLDQLPAHFEGIIIANEVLDAIPVNCFCIENNAIKERLIITEKDNLSWYSSEPRGKGLVEAKKKLKNLYSFPEGYESEINLQLSYLIDELTRAIVRGVLFFVDYGYGQKEYYRPDRLGGTLACFYK